MILCTGHGSGRLWGGLYRGGSPLATPGGSTVARAAAGAGQIWTPFQEYFHIIFCDGPWRAHLHAGRHSGHAASCEYTHPMFRYAAHCKNDSLCIQPLFQLGFITELSMRDNTMFSCSGAVVSKQEICTIFGKLRHLPTFSLSPSPVPLWIQFMWC